MPDGRDTLKRALEHAGFDVDYRGTGSRALTLAAARAPAVVISEIDLRGMSGSRLAGALGTTFDDGIRLIALTARDDSYDRRRSHAAGFDAPGETGRTSTGTGNDSAAVARVRCGTAQLSSRCAP